MDSRRTKPPEQALLHVKENIRRDIEDKLYSVGLFIDLRKPFDCANDDILLLKLHDYGIRGVPLDLLKSYLSSRNQRVKIVDVIPPPPPLQR